MAPEACTGGRVRGGDKSHIDSVFGLPWREDHRREVNKLPHTRPQGVGGLEPTAFFLHEKQSGPALVRAASEKSVALSEKRAAVQAGLELNRQLRTERIQGHACSQT